MNLFLKIAGIVAVAEFAAMLLLNRLGIPRGVGKGVLDALLMVALGAPFLYFLVVRPAVRGLAREAELERELSRQELLRERKAKDDAETVARLTQGWRRTFDAMRDGVWLLDKEHLVVQTNAVAETILGRTGHQTIGRPCSEVMHGADCQPPTCPLLRVRESLGREIEEFQIGEKWVEVVVDPLLDEAGHYQGAVHSVRDVTERKLMEGALRDSEKRFRSTFEQAAVGIAHVSSDGRWLRVNQKLCDIVGHSREELLARTIQEITHPDDLETDLASMRQVLAGQIANYSIEKRYLRKDGSSVPINLTVALVRDEAGQPDHFISVVEDISARVRAEEEKEKLRANLQQAQKMEAVGRLAGGVAHDFNNLLSIILSNSSFALETIAPGGSGREDIEGIQAAGVRAATLTRQLLSFSRQQVLQPRLLDLNGLIRDLTRMLARFLGEHIVIALELAPTLGLVRADPGQLEQVILNLALNARDAMPGGGKLLIETANVELDGDYQGRHAAGTTGPFVRLSVSDTGSGMDPETKARAFEPFFTTKEMGQGTGLGLASVYGIVKQSGGFIWVYSEPGHGTTFKIDLPRESPAEPPWTPGAGPGRLRGGDESVLVVEDGAEVRGAAVRSLRGLGYRVVEADGLESARHVAAEEPCLHLLVTDVVMPGGSGREVARAVKAAHPGVKVIYMSGYTDSAALQNGVLGQGVTFLQKPFTPAVLGRLARQVLDGVESS